MPEIMSKNDKEKIRAIKKEIQRGIAQVERLKACKIPVEEREEQLVYFTELYNNIMREFGVGEG